MKIDSIAQSNKQSFKGSFAAKTANYIAKHPRAIAVLAGSSVVAQKVVMSGSEALLGTTMDVGIGKAITKITDEKDGRTNESSKTQAIRTFSQSFGGTIIGVLVRGACIGVATLGVSKLGAKAGEKIGKEIAENDKTSKFIKEASEIINPKKITEKENAFEFEENIQAWGRNAGGVLSTIVMLVTNFVIDVPFINYVNKKTTDFVEKRAQNKTENKEVK